MIEGISVALRLIDKPTIAVRALCDVTIDFGEEGQVEISGFRLIQPDGKPAWVSAPSRQGKSNWFQVVKLRGQLKSDVETAVLKKYEEMGKLAAKT